MSTRTRIVLEIEGQYWAGAQATATLHKHAIARIAGYKPKRLDLDAMKAVLASIQPYYKRVGLHVFREPRRVRDVRSRYKRIVLRYGLGRRRGRGGDEGRRVIVTSSPSSWMRAQSIRVPQAVPEQQAPAIPTTAAQWGWEAGTQSGRVTFRDIHNNIYNYNELVPVAETPSE